MNLDSNPIGPAINRRSFLQLPVLLWALSAFTKNGIDAAEIGGPWFPLYEWEFARDKKTGERVWCYRGNIYYLKATWRPAPNSSEECDIERFPVPNLRKSNELGWMWEKISQITVQWESWN